MKITYKILKEYFANFSLSPDGLRDLFPLINIEVKEYKYLGEGLKGFLVSGLIEDVSYLPGSQEYKLLKVNIGGKSLQVVSTAPNVRKGLKVVAALPGAQIKGIIIEEREIKGYKSEANLVSLEELGFPVGSTGVFELPGDFPVGVCPLDYLGLDDWSYDLYTFPNRPDQLGIIGLAIDISAQTGDEIVWPRVGVEESCDDVFPIVVEDTEGCPIYTARIIKNVMVKDSPFEFQKKLMLLGQRPINNVVDVTNYVMFELGQPIHAFDLRKLKEKIVVRRAKSGEKILCLDGNTYELNPEILVIADSIDPVAVAGIIGGEDSSVTYETRDILIESAYFDRIIIRKGVLDLGISTESSKRFEKGGDPSIPEVASKRVAFLVKRFAGGDVCKVNAFKGKTFEQKRIYLFAEEVNRLLGLELKIEDVKKIIERLGFVAHKKENYLEVVVPFRRRDIEVWQDVAEEILKLVGYDNIKPETKSCGEFAGRKHRGIERLLRDVLSGIGFNEVRTIEFENPDLLSLLGYSEADFVKIKNPIHSELSVLRTTLILGLLKVASKNLRRGVDYVKIFEVGKTYLWRGAEELPDERLTLGICVGGKISKTWDYSERKIDLYDLLAAFDVLKEIFDKPLRIEAADLSRRGLWNSGIILCGDDIVGVIGEVSLHLRKALDLKDTVFVLQLELDNLGVKAPSFKGIPMFPATDRDVSVVLDKADSIKGILEIATSIFGSLLEEYKVIDIFEGSPIPQGKKSITIKFVFRAADRTLTQEEVDEKFSLFVENLKSRGFSIRGINA